MKTLLEILIRLIRVLCFFVFVIWVAITGTFFGLIGLAAEFGLMFFVYYLAPIPIFLSLPPLWKKATVSFLFGWMGSEKEMDAN